jgi:glycosyltransferase involved in cell wall biosynthesis
LNVLFTVTAYPPSLGGAQLLMHRLARQLRPRIGVQVVTQWDARRTDWLWGTTLRGPREAITYEIDGVPVARITLSEQDRRRLRPWVWGYYLAQGPALRRIAAALAAAVQPWAAGADLVHNCRIGREGLSFASLAVAREKDVPFVLTPVHHPRWGGWLHRHYQRLYRLADAVIALTEAERRALAALGVPEGRIFVTGMGPVLGDDPSGARFRARHGLADDPLVLFLGQKYAFKGAGLLLRAAPGVWARHPRTRFAFLGPRTSHSRRAFAGMRDPRVLELDEVDLAEKTDALDACDVFCLPSTQESFGGVFTEAWSLGKPVVGCDIPAVREVIEPGEDGLVCPPEAAALARSLDELLSDPARRKALGERGRAKVSRLYTWPRLAERTEAVYRAVRKNR